MATDSPDASGIRERRWRSAARRRCGHDGSHVLRRLRDRFPALSGRVAFRTRAGGTAIAMLLNDVARPQAGVSEMKATLKN